MKKSKKEKINWVTKYHLTQLNQSCWLMPCYKLHLQGVLLPYLFHYQIKLITWHLGQRNIGMNIKHLLRVSTFWENLYHQVLSSPNILFQNGLYVQILILNSLSLKNKFVSLHTPCTLLYVSKLTMLSTWVLNSRSNSLKLGDMIQSKPTRRWPRTQITIHAMRSHLNFQVKTPPRI